MKNHSKASRRHDPANGYRLGRARSRLLTAALVVTLLAAAAAVGLWTTYRHIGRTPGELMDYAERRLQGHPRLEAIALPLMGGVRNWLDAPTLAARRALRFVVPRPPALALTTTGADAGIARPGRRVLRVGPTETVTTIAEAARLAVDDDIVEIQAGEYRGDVAVWNQKRLTIRGVGGHARLFADAQSAEGKAIWVIRNGDFDIANVDFLEARVPDHNGAGIRFENGHLRIANCLFWGNENGVLTTSTDSELEVIASEFGYNGAGDGLSHHIYAGQIRSLKVTASYFHHANVGHLLKSRAARNEIVYNRFTDEIGGRASYELDFPNGGLAYVIGNIIQQTRETENSALIAYGEEGIVHRENSLLLSNNTLVNDHPHGGTFVRAAPGARRISMVNNLFIGPGRLDDATDVASFHNVRADWDIFVQASRYDYRLLHPAPELSYQAVESDLASRVVGAPTSEYVHPLKRRPLAGLPAFVGAIQSIP